MKKSQKTFGLIALFLVLITIGVYFVLEKKAELKSKQQADTVPIVEKKADVSTIEIGKIKHDSNWLKELQTGVDEGHMPWRREPLDVIYPDTGIDPDITFDGKKDILNLGKIVSGSTELGKIIYEIPFNDRTYDVTVIQPTVGKNKIWVVSDVEYVESDQTADWKIYKNTNYGFEIKYPLAWIVKESKEDTMLGSTIESISFQTTTKDVGWIKSFGKNSNESIVFGVKIYTLQEYTHDRDACVQAVKENYEPSDCLRMLNELGRNSQYVFVYYSPGGAGLNPYPSDFDALFPIGDTSAKSFKLIQ